VVSFDEGTVLLRTQMGTLVIQGQNLQLKQLSLEGGNVAVDGEVSALVYEENRTSRNLWGRLFG
jgi:sporulation protein YabP